jgi:hypothetical protein
MEEIRALLKHPVAIDARPAKVFAGAATQARLRNWAEMLRETMTCERDATRKFL